MKITGKVLHIQHLGHSYFGNPYFNVVLETEHGIVDVRTKINAGINYEIENFKGQTVTFGLTRSGRIESVDR